MRPSSLFLCVGILGVCACDPSSKADSGPGGGTTPDDTATSDDTGSTPPPFGDAASDSFYQGSWRSPVKVGSRDPANAESCAQPVGWQANDVDAMLNVLESTNQNLYIAHMDTTGDDLTSCDWQNLTALRDAITDGSVDVDLMASLPNNFTLEEYETAIASLRALAAGHGSVEGVVIDDFSSTLVAPWDYDETGFSSTDVASLLSAASDTAGTSDPTIQFVPYVPAHHVPTHVLPAVLFGVRGCYGDGSDCPGVEEDYYIYPGTGGYDADVLMAETTFDPGPIGTDETFELSFLVHDMVEATLTDRTLDLIVDVNDAEVARYNLYDVVEGDGYIDLVSGEVTDLVASSDNTLSMRLEAGTYPLNRYHQKLVFAWDIQLTRTDGDPIRFDADDMTYTASRDEDRTAGTTDQFLASSTSEWNVSDAFDGLLFKYSSEDVHTDLAAHKRLVQSTCTVMQASGRKCLEVHWGNAQWQDTVTFDFGNIATLFEHDQAHADGIVVWRLEGHVGAPTRGVFADRDPWTPTDFEVGAAYPGWMPSIPEWRLGWTITATLTGHHTLAFGDNLAGFISSYDGRMVHRVIVTGSSGTIVAVDVDVNDFETDGARSFIASEGDEIRVEMGTTGSFGNVDWRAQYRLIDPNGATMALDTSPYTASVDLSTERMFDCTAAYFTSHAYRDTCR